MERRALVTRRAEERRGKEGEEHLGIRWPCPGECILRRCIAQVKILRQEFVGSHVFYFLFSAFFKSIFYLLLFFSYLVDA